MRENLTWEQPIPFKSVELPLFPVSELPVIVADYVRAVSETTQTAPDMAAVASLAILALSLQGKYIIEGKADWQEPLNLYTLIVAPPAERKSAVMKLMSEPIRQFESTENKRIAPLIEQNKIEKSILENRKKVLEAKHSKDKISDYSEIREISEEISEFKEIRQCKLACDDITPERLAGIMAENNGRTAILSSEGGIFDMLAGRYSQSINIDVFLKAHSGDSIRVDRQGRQSDYIDNPALTVLIFTQPEIMANLMSNKIFHNCGLCARFLYSLPQSIVGKRKFESNPIPEITSDRYYNLVERLLKIKNEQPKVITLSEKSYSILKDFYDKTEPAIIDELSDIKDFAGKYVGAVLRIAGLLYIAENAENIHDYDLILSESFIKSAIAIGEYFLEHAKAAYQLMGVDEVTEQSKYILRQLQKSPADIVTLRDVMRLCRKLKTAEAAFIPITRLCEYGYFKEKQSKIWEVNPLTYKLEF